MLIADIPPAPGPLSRLVVHALLRSVHKFVEKTRGAVLANMLRIIRLRKVARLAAIPIRDYKTDV